MRCSRKKPVTEELTRVRRQSFDAMAKTRQHRDRSDINGTAPALDFRQKVNCSRPATSATDDNGIKSTRTGRLSFAREAARSQLLARSASVRTLHPSRSVAFAKSQNLSVSPGPGSRSKPSVHRSILRNSTLSTSTPPLTPSAGARHHVRANQRTDRKTRISEREKNVLLRWANRARDQVQSRRHLDREKGKHVQVKHLMKALRQQDPADGQKTLPPIHAAERFKEDTRKSNRSFVAGQEPHKIKLLKSQCSFDFLDAARGDSERMNCLSDLDRFDHMREKREREEKAKQAALHFRGTGGTIDEEDNSSGPVWIGEKERMHSRYLPKARK